MNDTALSGANGEPDEALPATPPLPALLGCLPLVGHVPGFRQPAMRADFLLDDHAPPAAALGRLDEVLGAACPAYAACEAPLFLAAHPVLQRVLRLHLALLTQARCPLFGEARLLGMERDNAGRLRVGLLLPCLGQDAPWMHGLLGDALAIVTALLAGRELPADALARAARLAALVAPRGFNSSGLLRAADRRDIPWARVGENVMQLGWGARARLLDSTYTDSTSNIGARIARDKLVNAAVLRRCGLPAPMHLSVRDAEQAVRAARHIGWPVVVKPRASDGGRGVSIHLRDEAAVREAFARAREESARRWPPRRQG